MFVKEWKTQWSFMSLKFQYKMQVVNKLEIKRENMSRFFIFPVYTDIIVVMYSFGSSEQDNYIQRDTVTRFFNPT
jgi:hypothetical protein